MPASITHNEHKDPEKNGLSVIDGRIFGIFKEETATPHGYILDCSGVFCSPLPNIISSIYFSIKFGNSIKKNFAIYFGPRTDQNK